MPPPPLPTRQAEAGADGRPLRQRTGPDVGAMFQQQAAAATAAHWQIVSIAPTAQPGEQDGAVWAGYS